jgi:tRNA-2-methylthio-N6-dimethylallyladenosine synthase
MNYKYLYIYTIGCQMNVYDSAMFEKVLKPLGYIMTEKPEDADMVIVNTCSVRKKAEDKAYSFLGRFDRIKKKNPELILAVSGCVAQQNGKGLIDRLPYVDIVFGTRMVGRLPRLVKRFEETREKIVEVTLDERVEEFSFPDLTADDSTEHEDKPISRFTTITRGCDNFCTYCIVPYVRGREKSRTPEFIVDEITRYASEGIKEITLLGQNVNSYGIKEGLCSFPELLYKVNEIKGIERIRFATSHPKDLSQGLIEAYKRLNKLCNHIHLPVQSGSDRILKKMNRKYTSESYIEKITELKKVRPDIAVTSDFIVGFPGETREDFDQTLELVRKIGFDGLFAFTYSDRPDAPAVKFPDKVPSQEKKDRLDKLLKLEKELSLQNNLKRVGKMEEVLVEGLSKKKDSQGNINFTGRSSGNKVVNFLSDESGVRLDEIRGKLVKVTIEKGLPHSLWGRMQKG